MRPTALQSLASILMTLTSALFGISLGLGDYREAAVALFLWGGSAGLFMSQWKIRKLRNDERRPGG